MKGLKYILLATLCLALYSCGQNSSGGGAGVVGGSIGINGDGSITAGTSGQNFQSINEVRNAFNSMSLETGVTENMFIYHIGSYYTGNSGGISGGISISGCFFGIFGDCDNNNNQSNYYLQQYLDYGRLIKVGHLDQNSETLNLGEATGVSNNDYIYSNYVLTRNDNEYRAMLGMNLSYTKVKLSGATIELTSGQRVKGIAVEYINESFGGHISNIKRYVLSTNLPIAANPIAIIDGIYPQVTGVLNSVGNTTSVREIDIDAITQTNGGYIFEDSLSIIIN